MAEVSLQPLHWQYIAFEAFALLVCYAALSGSQLPMFRDSPLVPTSAVTDYQSMLLNIPEQQRQDHSGRLK